MQQIFDFMKKYLILIIATVLFNACSSNDEPEVVDPERTVLVYMAGENSLASFVIDDLTEMKKGSLSLDNRHNLIVYIDERGKNPFMARVKDGRLVDSVAMDKSISADPAVLESMLHRARTNYPAKS